MKRVVVALIVLLGLGLIAAPAVAQTLDPQLFICQSCTSPPGGDPNIINNTTNFTVGIDGKDVMQNPLLIVIANYDSSAQPTVSFGSTASEPLASVGTYGLTTNHFDPFNSTTGGTVFSNLGLQAGGTLSFGNLSTADTGNGFAAPSFFSLWAFAVPINLSGAVSGFDVSGAAQGSFINAYDCINGTGTSSGCAKNGDIGQSVNTNQGLISKVPEPTSMALLGTVLLGAYGLIRRKLSPETES